MDLTTARNQMINQQLRTWDVLDARVLDVVRETPRENFVPKAYQQMAFADAEIPLARGEHMFTPMLEGRILQSLEVQAEDSALLIGAGSGYLTACLAGLAGRVTAYERHEELALQAEQALSQLSHARQVELVPETFGRETGADGFDVIAVCGSVARIDQRLRTRLNAGGRLFAIEGTGLVQRAQLIRRLDGDDFASETLFDTQIAPLVGYEPAPRFDF